MKSEILAKIQAKILAIILTFSLGGCIFFTENTLKQAVDANSFINRFPNNQKSIIIFKFSGRSGPISSDKIYLCQKENFVQNNNNCKTIDATNQYRILMLPPNLYYIVSLSRNVPIFSDKFPLDQKSLTILDIKAGEIIYAGDISFKRGTEEKEDGELVEDFNFGIRDNFSLLKNLLEGKNSKKTAELFANQKLEIDFLIKQYPELKGRLIKKLFKTFRLEQKEIQSETLKPQNA